MKVRMIRKVLAPLAGSDGPVRIRMPGEVYDLPRPEAVRLVAAGYAVPADPNELKAKGA